jgi:hypothetical protein
LPLSLDACWAIRDRISCGAEDAMTLAVTRFDILRLNTC